MTIRVLRSKMRFAVRSKARLRKAGSRAVPGLLVELSLEGCRISNVNHTRFALGQIASVQVDGHETLEGHVRWAHDGFVGLRFVHPLHTAALDRLIDVCRGDDIRHAEAELSYGT